MILKKGSRYILLKIDSMSQAQHVSVALRIMLISFGPVASEKPQWVISQTIIRLGPTTILLLICVDNAMKN